MSTGMKVTLPKVQPYGVGEKRQPFQQVQRRAEQTASPEGNGTKRAMTVLSKAELSTIQTLFGEEQPERTSIYGPAKMHVVEKGQFLDVRG